MTYAYLYIHRCAYALKYIVHGAGAYSVASSAVWWAASLPPTCRESPDLQWRHTPVLHPGLRATGACLEVATVGCPPRLILSQSGRDGRLGNCTPCRLCPVQLGGPAARASSPHTGPTPPRRVALLAAKRRGSSARLVAMMAHLLNDSAPVVADAPPLRARQGSGRQ